MLIFVQKKIREYCEASQREKIASANRRVGGAAASAAQARVEVYAPAIVLRYGE